MHQRVAKTFRSGRAFLIGDAAHVNTLSGGMGMNGGIHDAINLTGRLIDVWRGRSPRPSSIASICNAGSSPKNMCSGNRFENKKNLEAADNEFRDWLLRTAADPALVRDYLLRSQ